MTNITRLSGAIRNGRIFVVSDWSVQPANDKRKAKVVTKETNEASPTPDEDVPVGRFAEKGKGFGRKKVSLEEANEFLRIIQQSKFKIIEQLNKTPTRVSLFELLMSSEPHWALLVKVLNEAHMAQDISIEGFEGIVNNITTNRART